MEGGSFRSSAYLGPAAKFAIHPWRRGCCAALAYFRPLFGDEPGLKCLEAVLQSVHPLLFAVRLADCSLPHGASASLHAGGSRRTGSRGSIGEQYKLNWECTRRGYCTPK